MKIFCLQSLSESAVTRAVDKLYSYGQTKSLLVKLQHSITFKKRNRLSNNYYPLNSVLFTFHATITIKEQRAYTCGCVCWWVTGETADLLTPLSLSLCRYVSVSHSPLRICFHWTKHTTNRDLSMTTMTTTTPTTVCVCVCVERTERTVSSTF